MSEKNSYVNQFFKFINTAVGRDKINRTLQFFFKFLLAFNIKYTANEELIAWIRVVLKHIQLSRKFFRIGRPLEHLNKFYQSLSLKDDISKYCALGRNLTYAIYFTFDMMIWLHLVGIMDFENIKIISKNAQMFRLMGIAFGIFNQLYKLNRIKWKLSEINNTFKNKETKIQRKKKNNNKKGNDNKKKNDSKKENDNKKEKDIKSLIDKRKEDYLTLIQFSCDFLQPLSSLRIFRVEPITLSTLGIVSSILGARTQWIKVNGKK